MRRLILVALLRAGAIRAFGVRHHDLLAHREERVGRWHQFWLVLVLLFVLGSRDSVLFCHDEVLLGRLF